MDAIAPNHFRLCPNCGSERPVSELHCEGVVDGQVCGWPLFDEQIQTLVTFQVPEPSSPARRCVNGHEIGPGDQICLECGADLARGDAPEPIEPGTTPAPVGETTID